MLFKTRLFTPLLLIAVGLGATGCLRGGAPVEALSSVDRSDAATAQAAVPAPDMMMTGSITGPGAAPAGGVPLLAPPTKKTDSY